MKKIIFTAIAVFAMSFVSCGNCSKDVAGASTDTVAADTVELADSLTIDSVQPEVVAE